MQVNVGSDKQPVTIVGDGEALSSPARYVPTDARKMKSIDSETTLIRTPVI